MQSLDCRAARALLDEGDSSPPLLAHLASCAACRARGEATEMVRPAEPRQPRRDPVVRGRAVTAEDRPANLLPWIVGGAAGVVIVVSLGVIAMRHARARHARDGAAAEMDTTRRTAAGVVATETSRTTGAGVVAAESARPTAAGATATEEARPAAAGAAAAEAGGAEPTRLARSTATPATAPAGGRREPAVEPETDAGSVGRRDDARASRRAARPGAVPSRTRSAGAGIAPSAASTTPADSAGDDDRSDRDGAGGRAGARARADEDLGQAPAIGFLSLASDPWARVFLDGRDTGRSTPIVKMSVAAGRHHVELRTRTSTTALDITVARGRELRLNKRLE